MRNQEGMRLTYGLTGMGLRTVMQQIRQLTNYEPMIGIMGYPV